MPDLANIASAVDKAGDMWPAWLAIAISAIVAFNRAVEESDKAAKMLGGWGRRIRDRAAKRRMVDFAATEFAEAVSTAVEDARNKWKSDENAALKALDDRLDTVARVTHDQKRDLEDLRYQVRCMMAHNEYEVLWHHQLQVQVASAPGACLELHRIPDYLDYWQFEKTYQANEHWREWVNRP